MKSHLQSYPCPLQINSLWNLGFLLGITIILQIITGIFLGLHYTSLRIDSLFLEEKLCGLLAVP
jgi:quinol-cytochrome oxidoreductase complex cytochrome b subunit